MAVNFFYGTECLPLKKSSCLDGKPHNLLSICKDNASALLVNLVKDIVLFYDKEFKTKLDQMVIIGNIQCFYRYLELPKDFLNDCFFGKLFMYQINNYCIYIRFFRDFYDLFIEYFDSFFLEGRYRDERRISRSLLYEILEQAFVELFSNLELTIIAENDITMYRKCCVNYFVVFLSMIVNYVNREVFDKYYIKFLAMIHDFLKPMWEYSNQSSVIANLNGQNLVLVPIWDELKYILSKTTIRRIELHNYPIDDEALRLLGNLALVSLSFSIRNLTKESILQNFCGFESSDVEKIGKNLLLQVHNRRKRTRLMRFLKHLHIKRSSNLDNKWQILFWIISEVFNNLETYILDMQCKLPTKYEIFPKCPFREYHTSVGLTDNINFALYYPTKDNITTTKYFKPLKNCVIKTLQENLVSLDCKIDDLTYLNKLLVNHVHISTLKVELKAVNVLHLHKFDKLKVLHLVSYNRQLTKANFLSELFQNLNDKLTELTLENYILEDFNPFRKINSLRYLSFRSCRFLPFDQDDMEKFYLPTVQCLSLVTKFPDKNWLIMVLEMVRPTVLFLSDCCINSDTDTRLDDYLIKLLVNQGCFLSVEVLRIVSSNYTSESVDLLFNQDNIRLLELCKLPSVYLLRDQIYKKNRKRTIFRRIKEVIDILPN